MSRRLDHLSVSGKPGGTAVCGRPDAKYTVSVDNWMAEKPFRRRCKVCEGSHLGARVIEVAARIERTRQLEGSA